MSKRDYGWIAILCLVIAISVGRCSSQRETIKSKDQIIAEKESKIQEVKLENGKIASDKLRVESDLNTLKKGYSFLEDSLESMGIKAKKMRSALFLAQQTKGKGSGRVDTIQVVRNDTVEIASQLKVREKFFKFDAMIYSSNNFQYEYSFMDSLAIVNVTSRPNIFSKRVHTVRVVNANPDVKISGVTSLSIVEKRDRIHLGASLIVGHDGERLRPFVGVGVSYSFISF